MNEGNRELVRLLARLEGEAAGRPTFAELSLLSMLKTFVRELLRRARTKMRGLLHGP